MMRIAFHISALACCISTASAAQDALCFSIDDENVRFCVPETMQLLERDEGDGLVGYRLEDNLFSMSVVIGQTTGNHDTVPKTGEAGEFSWPFASLEFELLEADALGKAWSLQEDVSAFEVAADHSDGMAYYLLELATSDEAMFVTLIDFTFADHERQDFDQIAEYVAQLRRNVMIGGTPLSGNPGPDGFE